MSRGASAPADRVVIVVFDGLRPDMIDGRMPGLAAFGTAGVTFSGARSVFPSLTRVATTSLASGHWPRGHGIVGNAFHQPDIVAGAALDTSSFAHLMLARAAWGRVVAPQTLGEALAAQGLRMAVVHAGSPGAAFLADPEVVANGHSTFSIHGADATQTPQAVTRAIAAQGALPKGEIPRFEHIAYATQTALAEVLASDGPDVVLVWFSEPDTSYHYREIGSETTAAALRAVDDAFVRLLDAARKGPRGGRTAVLALSDHGQITTTGLFGLEAALRVDGFAAAVRPADSDRIALTLGFSGECRMLADEAALAPELAAWLMARDEIGMVFARDDLMAAIPGALPMSAAMLDHPRAAGLEYVMRSDDGPDHHGLPGRGLMSGGVPVGGGMHGGLNRHELATVLRLSLPDGPAGVIDDRPCALPDVAPTVLALLGLAAPGMAGTALPLDGATGAAAQTETLTAEAGAFRQTLVRRHGGARLVLEHGGRC